MKYDTENFLTDLVTFLKANLNTSITAMNTLKGDTILKAIDNNAYFIQTLNDKSANYDPFIFIVVENMVTLGERIGETATQLVISLVIIYQNFDDSFNRSFRYQRILKELLEEKLNIGGRNMKIETLVPMAIDVMQSGLTCDATGLRLNVVI